MKRVLIAAIFALLLTTSCHAQQKQQAAPGLTPSMDALLGARAKLIQRYVQSLKIARGVAVCGTTDLLTDEEHSYLCVYVYRDSVQEFLNDFVNFATETAPGGSLGIDGVSVSVTLIGPVKAEDKIPNVQPKPALGIAPPSKT